MLHLRFVTKLPFADNATKVGLNWWCVRNCALFKFWNSFTIPLSYKFFVFRNWDYITVRGHICFWIKFNLSFSSYLDVFLDIIVDVVRVRKIAFVHDDVPKVEGGELANIQAEISRKVACVNFTEGWCSWQSPASIKFTGHAEPLSLPRCLVTFFDNTK